MDILNILHSNSHQRNYVSETIKPLFSLYQSDVRILLLLLIPLNLQLMSSNIF